LRVVVENPWRSGVLYRGVMLLEDAERSYRRALEHIVHLSVAALRIVYGLVGVCYVVAQERGPTDKSPKMVVNGPPSNQWTTCSRVGSSGAIGRR
jgi:hypothetical protein